MAETVKGLKKLLKILDVPVEDIDGILGANSGELAQKARTKAPINLGKLKGSIRSYQVGELDWRVTAGVPYAAYVEFGTGGKTVVPQELREQAALAKSAPKGSFRDGLKSVTEWCRRKGIPEEAAWPIFMSILRNGIKPQPYMYPALLQQRPELMKDLEKYFQRRFK